MPCAKSLKWLVYCSFYVFSSRIAERVGLAFRQVWSQVLYWEPFAQFLHLGLGGIVASSKCECVS